MRKKGDSNNHEASLRAVPETNGLGWVGGRVGEPLLFSDPPYPRSFFSLGKLHNVLDGGGRHHMEILLDHLRYAKYFYVSLYFPLGLKKALKKNGI